MRKCESRRTETLQDTRHNCQQFCLFNHKLPTDRCNLKRQAGAHGSHHRAHKHMPGERQRCPEPLEAVVAQQCMLEQQWPLHVYPKRRWNERVLSKGISHFRRVALRRNASTTRATGNKRTIAATCRVHQNQPLYEIYR